MVRTILKAKCNSVKQSTLLIFYCFVREYGKYILRRKGNYPAERRRIERT